MCICSVYYFPYMLLSHLMTAFLFIVAWKWERTSDRLLPRKREAPRVFASIILILTQRPYSAAVVRFSNSRRMSGAGWKKSPLACSNANCAYELSKDPLSCPWRMTVSVNTASLGEKRYPSTTLLSRRIQMEDLPLCTFPKVRTYIDGSILHWCVFFLCSVLSASGETYACCSGVFWSVIIFSVWVFLCPRLSVLPNWGRHLRDKSISGFWQNLRLSRLRGLGMFFLFFFQKGRTFLSLQRTWG